MVGDGTRNRNRGEGGRKKKQRVCASEVENNRSGRSHLARTMWRASTTLSLLAVLVLPLAATALARSSIPFLRGLRMSTTTYPIYGEESIMRPKAHGTSEKPVQENLRWGCDWKTADRICNFNRHYAGIRCLLSIESL